MAVDLKWLAGFFDGEGSVGIYPRNWDRTKTIRYYVLVVSLAQSGVNGKIVLDKLKSKYGGTVTQAKSTGKPMFKWNIAANKAGKFLQDIEPFTILKKLQIQMAFKFNTLESKRHDNPNALEIDLQMRQEKLT